MSIKPWLSAATLAALSVGCSEDPDTSPMTGGAGTAGAVGVGGTAGTAGGTAGTAGTGAGGMGGTAGGGGTGTTATLPADNSAASITAFLDAQSFTAADWVSETAAPREPSTTVSPHGRVRVYMSGPLVDFKRNNPETSSPTVHGAMAVKEFYDASDAVVGYAVSLYMDPPGQVTYYCYGDGGRCDALADSAFTKDTPIHGTGPSGNASSCRGCHNGLVYTPAPP